MAVVKLLLLEGHQLPPGPNRSTQAGPGSTTTAASGLLAAAAAMMAASIAAVPPLQWMQWRTAGTNGTQHHQQPCEAAWLLLSLHCSRSCLNRGAVIIRVQQHHAGTNHGMMAERQKLCGRLLFELCNIERWLSLFSFRHVISLERPIATAQLRQLGNIELASAFRRSSPAAYH